MITGYRFLGGPIASHGLVHFLNTIGPSHTKVVYAYFDRISYVHTISYNLLTRTIIGSIGIAPAKDDNMLELRTTHTYFNMNLCNARMWDKHNNQ